MHTRLFLVLTLLVLVLLVAPGAAVAADPPSAAPDVGDPYEPNDTKSTATLIDFPGGIWDATLDPAGDQDFYRFTAVAGEYVLADVGGGGDSGIDTALVLYGGANCGKQLAANDNYLDYPDPHIEMRLPANGDYCLRVRGANHPNDGGPEFDYGIVLIKGDAYEPSDSPAEAAPLAYGQTIEATIHHMAAYFGNYMEFDFYRFEGRKGDHVLARATGGGIEAIVALLGMDGKTVLNMNYGFPAWNDAMAQATLPADGAYLVRVEGWCGEGGCETGPYTLTLDRGEFVSAQVAGTVDGIAFDRRDILLHLAVADRWKMLFDMSLAGIGANVNAFNIPPGESGVLMSFQTAQAVTLDVWPDYPTVTIAPHDIVLFWPRGVVAGTRGTFHAFFDGSDVGLSTVGEKIDALAVAPDGRLLISTTGGGDVPGAGRFQDEDILAFVPTQWGTDTAGTWSLYFDGSTVPGLAREDVTGIDTGVDGDLHLTTADRAIINGVNCGPTCIVTVHPDGTAEALWDARDHRFPFRLDGIDLPGGGEVLWP